ncbi:MAG: hypothetical protein EON58_08500 [Alphaproteobacteria bacterium]|nr:MAG: hypothetical protein EON58_08500 [Alphaproteobacteria bacterium]
MSDPFLTAMGIIGSRELTDPVLAETMGVLRAIFKEMDLEPTRRRLEAMVGVSMRPGEGLSSGENVPWVSDTKARIKWTYWDSYVTQLQSQGFTGTVLSSVDEDTDNILTECGNPELPGAWRVQGLVMGDVQSGKTANYCGLISKAADSGYKVIVLLTGMIEELRSQSQERMDEGFVGRDSNSLLDGVQGHIIGAGRFRDVGPNVLTSVSSDFLTANQRSLKGIPLQNLSEPLLLVMKKNMHPLSRLIEFLKGQMKAGSNALDLPLLIVDDESDNASVNANKDENPAMINSLMRELLSLFRRATYVGYTATPFANIFINPDPERGDLFPKNFIYSLRAPTNYIGAASLFLDDAPFADQLIDIEDAAAVFPPKHKKHLLVELLPASMEDAIGVFLISCAIRDLRQEPLNHRSMLINVTRLTDVQARVAERVKAYLFSLVSEIKQYMAADEIWRGHQSLLNLESLYLEQYADSGISWDSVRAKLYDSVASVRVLTINQKSEAEDRLNYGQYRNTEKGRRVIAIGGQTLSRGITLEGLAVSYFYRDSKAYDTLLQMGRWFGYRPYYDDLCRVWMTSEAQDWFRHIAEVVAELRADIRHMHTNRLPPEKFGMRVKSHPNTLLVTASNKMRNSSEVEIKTSYSAHATETPALYRDKEENRKNAEATQSYLRSLGPSEMSGTRHLWRKRPAAEVASFLRSLHISPLNQAFLVDRETGESPLIAFIADNDQDGLAEWDICVAPGSGAEAEGLRFMGPAGNEVTVRKRMRQFELPASRSSAYIKVNKQRVGEIADEKVDLDPNVVREVEKEWKLSGEKKTVPGREYRKKRQRPLLTIHPIQPIERGGDGPDAIPDKPSKSGKPRRPSMPVDGDVPPLFVALSLSFPEYEDTEENAVLYRLNKVYLQNAGLLDGDEDGDD